jgi:hypothetical protein
MFSVAEPNITQGPTMSIDNPLYTLLHPLGAAAANLAYSLSDGTQKVLDSSGHVTGVTQAQLSDLLNNGFTITAAA